MGQRKTRRSRRRLKEKRRTKRRTIGAVIVVGTAIRRTIVVVVTRSAIAQGAEIAAIPVAVAETTRRNLGETNSPMTILNTQRISLMPKAFGFQCADRHGYLLPLPMDLGEGAVFLMKPLTVGGIIGIR